MLQQGQQNFRQGLPDRIPAQKGIWAIAFISTNAKGEIQARTDEDVVSIFMPDHAQPDLGVLARSSRARMSVILDMAVEDAAKLIISAGLVYPCQDEPSRLPQPLPNAAE